MLPSHLGSNTTPRGACSLTAPSKIASLSLPRDPTIYSYLTIHIYLSNFLIVYIPHQHEVQRGQGPCLLFSRLPATSDFRLLNPMPSLSSRLQLSLAVDHLFLFEASFPLSSRTSKGDLIVLLFSQLLLLNFLLISLTFEVGASQGSVLWCSWLEPRL